MADFLPKNYKVPKSPSNYMKLEKGENRFRVLSDTITGYEYWNEDKKPVRLHEYPDRLPSDIQMKDEVPTSIKHFWAMVVWNYNADVDKDGNPKGKVQILEITPKTIQTPITTLSGNKKWGHPKKYDIVIEATGDGLEREYSVTPEPHSDVPPEAVEAYETKIINLEALFDGKDPFALEQGKGITEEKINPEDIPF